MTVKRCCETCRHDLGGGYENCKINLESECAAGGFEAWEPKERNDAIDAIAYSIAYGLASTGLLSKEIIGIAMGRNVHDLFGDGMERKEAKA